MATRQPYSRAPITEAILDLRVEPREDLTLTDLERCHASEEEAYPNKLILRRAAGHMQLGGAGEFSQTGSTEPIGFLFKSANEKQLFQVHRDGFTMNRLGLYPGWVVFRDEARRLWNVYRDCTRPRRVVRMAVRYINRLDLPGPGVDLKEYLKTWPEVSADLAQPLASFLMQLTIPQNDIRGTLQLTEASVVASAPRTASVALDIDLFRAEDLPDDDGEIWRLFEELRCRKNEVFEACITEKTRELIR